VEVAEMMKKDVTFSVIIPTRNRPTELLNCLKGFTVIDFPEDSWELIVVNDGGKDSFSTVMGELNQKLPLRLLNIEHSGPASARNRGAERAEGQCLAFIDDDCVPTPDWLSSLEKSFSEKPHHLLGGRTINVLSDNIFSTASHMLIDYLYQYHRETDSTDRFFTSNNLAVPADLFRDVGGFDRRMPLAAGEDREFCDRWLYYGYRMVHVPEAIVHHAHSLTLSSFLRQHFRYGRGAWLYQLIRRRRRRDGAFFYPSLFYIKLISYPWSRPVNHRGYTVKLITLLIMSQLANAAGFARQIFLGR
jgi:GT2 family glycosyltransferase